MQSSSGKKRSAHPHRLYKPLLVLAWIGLLLCGCAQPQVTPTQTPNPTSTPRPTATPPPPTATAVLFQPRFEPGECRFRRPPVRQIECGDLFVQEDRTQEDSPIIQLHVAILKSTSENPQPDPLIYLSGGPGSFALEWLYWNAEGYHDILQQRDVIVFDQRGIGYSQPSLDCSEVSDSFLETLSQNPSDLAWVDSKVGANLACEARLVREGIDLAAYNSASSAADVNDLRLALGYEKVNLLGLSYGTRLALTVMRDYPEIVRSVVLDSPVPLQLDILAAQGPNFEAALDLVFERCAADEQCQAAFPDLQSDFDALVDRLDAEPVTVRVTHLFTNRQSEMLVNGNVFISGVIDALYDPDTISQLPMVIHHLYHDLPGSDFLLADFMQVYLLRYDYSSEGARYSTLCSEETPFTSLEAALLPSAELPPRLQAYLEQDLTTDFRTCHGWLVEEPPLIENQAVHSDIPTLVLTGEFDPVTPYAWGELVSQGLSSAIHVQVPGMSHGVFSDSRCVRQVTADFLDQPTTEPDLSCVSALELYPLDFITR